MNTYDEDKLPLKVYYQLNCFI